LRFDFSHFQKVTDEELEKIEALVNHLIRQNYPREEHRNVPFDEAIKMGAIALFGEKYGDTVRVIKFGPSIELCGGTHVDATGQIGFFKIISESAVAAGIRRIEAITALEAERYVRNLDKTVQQLKVVLKSPKNIVQSVEKLIDTNKQLQKQVEQLLQEKTTMLKNALRQEVEQRNGINVIAKIVEVPSMDTLKNLAYQLKKEIDNMLLVLGARINGKANLAIMLSDNLVEKGLNADQIIREAAKEINGGGGGQPFFATAGGKNPDNLQKAIDKAVKLALEKLS
jgi:alanyl-tRNA synthetase